MFYVYIIYNKEQDKFYIGQTNDLNRRLEEHNLGLSGYTSKYSGFWRLVYQEEFVNRSEAMSRERFLKKQKSRSFYKSICNFD